MSTATKAAITAGTVGGGALGGAALGGAFSPKDKSQVSTQIGTNQAETPPNPTSKDTPKTSSSDTVSPKTPELQTITYSFLHEHNPIDPAYNQDSVAHKYKHLIVHPYGKENASNENWWSQSFKKYEVDIKDSTNQKNLTGDFVKENATKAFVASGSSEIEKSLNKACDTFYKKKLSDALNGNGDKEQKSKNKINFWKYCSPLVKAPVTVGEKQNYEQLYSNNNSIGRTNKDILLSVEEGDNDVLWEIKNKRFFGLTNVTSSFFQSLKTPESKKADKNALKNKCKEAYSKVSESGNEANDKVKIENVKKYCTVDLIT